jgi:hypothetical protein
MTMTKTMTKFLGLLVILAVPAMATGAPYYMGTIVNGDFEANGGSLAGWTASGFGGSVFALGSPGTNHTAYLSADGLACMASASLRQDNILVPANASYLSYWCERRTYSAAYAMTMGTGLEYLPLDYTGTVSMSVSAYRGEYMSLQFNVIAMPASPLGPPVPSGFASLLLDNFGFDAPGSTAINPLLPTASAQGPFGFLGAWSGAWVDPPMASGYRYVMSGTSVFTKIQGFPGGFGPLTVSVDGQVIASDLGPGDSVDFAGILGHGVSEFTVNGIDPQVDAADATAFPLELSFDSSTADFQMIAVPEPATLSLLALGGLAVLRRRRRK